MFAMVDFSLHIFILSFFFFIPFSFKCFNSFSFHSIISQTNATGPNTNTANTVFVFVSESVGVSVCTLISPLPLFLLDLSPAELSSSPSSHSSYIDGVSPTLHLIAYSVNQKGRSEPTVLEDIAINEAERRTGTCAL